MSLIIMSNTTLNIINPHPPKNRSTNIPPLHTGNNVVHPISFPPYSSTLNTIRIDTSTKEYTLITGGKLNNAVSTHSLNGE